MFPYSTPENRPLSSAERDFLEFLLRTNAPERLNELERLSVTARCGCGECPGILFSDKRVDQMTGQRPYLVADMITSGSPKDPIGVMLWGTDTELLELEFCSYGDTNVIGLPPVKDLKPFAA